MIYQYNDDEILLVLPTAFDRKKQLEFALTGVGNNPDYLTEEGWSATETWKEPLACSVEGSNCHLKIPIEYSDDLCEPETVQILLKYKGEKGAFWSDTVPWRLRKIEELKKREGDRKSNAVARDKAVWVIRGKTTKIDLKTLNATADDDSSDVRFSLPEDMDDVDGSASLENGSVLAYQATGATARKDSVRYNVVTKGGPSATGTVTVSVLPNFLPIGLVLAALLAIGVWAFWPAPLELVPDEFTVAVGEIGEINVLENDSLPEGDFTVRLVSSPGKGTARIDSQGRLRYQPYPNNQGGDQDQLLYSVKAGKQTGEAAVTVNLEPVRPPLTLQEDVIDMVPAGEETVDVLGNDNFPQQGDLTLSIRSQPQHGIVTVNNDDTLNVTLYDTAPLGTEDRLEYEVSVDGDSAVSSLTIRIPRVVIEAVDDEQVVNPGHTVFLDVLENDTLPADSYDIDLLTTPQVSTAEVLSDGTIELTVPAETPTGVTDQLEYELSFDWQRSQAIVRLQIEEPLIAHRDTLRLSGNVNSHPVLDNDDLPDGDPQIEIIAQPANGQARVLSNNRIEYQPGAGSVQEDELTYRVTVGPQSAEARLTILLDLSPLECPQDGPAGAMTYVPAGTYTVAETNNRVVGEVGEALGLQDVRLIRGICVQSNEVVGRQFQLFFNTLTQQERGAIEAEWRFDLAAPVTRVRKTTASRYGQWLENQVGSGFSVDLPRKSEWLATLIHAANTGSQAVFTSFMRGAREWTREECGQPRAGTYAVLGLPNQSRANPQYSVCVFEDFGPTSTGFRLVLTPGN